MPIAKIEIPTTGVKLLVDVSAITQKFNSPGTDEIYVFIDGITTGERPSGPIVCRLTGTWPAGINSYDRMMGELRDAT